MSKQGGAQGRESVLSFVPSRPTSDSPSSPGPVYLRTPPHSWSAKGSSASIYHVPLEPTPPSLCGEGALCLP